MWEPEMRYAQASTAHAPSKEYGPIRLAQARLRIFAAAVALAVLASTFGLAAPAVGSTGTCGATAASAFAAGAGTEQDPYRISSLGEFLLFASDSTKWGDHFLQTADINMDSCAFTPIGSSTRFSGVYDGGGKEIRKLEVIDQGDKSGMFRDVAGGTIKNLSLEVKIRSATGGQRSGGLIGQTQGGGSRVTVLNVDVAVDIDLTAGQVGGLIGSLSGEAHIENVNVFGAVSIGTGAASIDTLPVIQAFGVGGVIGYSDDGGAQNPVQHLKNVRMSADITHARAAGQSNEPVGGVIGGNDVAQTVLENVVVDGNISAVNQQDVGGLVGLAWQTGNLTIVDSQVFSEIEADTNVAGLIGNVSNVAALAVSRTTVQSSIEAKNSNAACLVAVFGTGVEDNTTITDSYWPQFVEVAGSKVMCDPVSPPALTMSGIPQLGRNVTIEYSDGYTPIGNYFDIWVCGSDAFENDRKPDMDLTASENKNCVDINLWNLRAVANAVTFQISTPTVDAATVPAINPATGQQWVNPLTGNELDRINRVNYCGTAGSPPEDKEGNDITGSLYLIVHDFRDPSNVQGLHSNWFGPIDCNEVSDPNEGLAGSSPSVTQPRPVAQPGSGRLPALPAGQGGVLINGAPAQVTVAPVVRTGAVEGVKVSGDGFEIELDPADADATRGRGQVLDTQLLLVQGEGVQTRMSGFQPSSPATLWLFSEPKLLGEFTVDASGNLDATVALLPDGVSACQHTVQVVGRLPGGGEIAANLGVWVVADPFPFTDTAAFSVHGPSVGCLESLGVVEGFGAERFSERARATRGQAATMIARLLDLPAATPTFSDAVTSTHAAGIGALQAAGLVNGFANGAFGPGTAITRGELATLVAAAYGLDAASSPFADAGETHAGAIGALYEAGVLSGFADGTFRPHAPITRGQLASVLVRAKYLLG